MSRFPPPGRHIERARLACAPSALAGKLGPFGRKIIYAERARMLRSGAARPPGKSHSRLTAVSTAPATSSSAG